MVLDEGKGSCPEDMVVDTLYLPVEVGQAELIIDHSTVAHTEGCPGWQIALLQMACQNLRGSWTGAVIPKCPWEEHDLQKTAMDHSQKSCHCPKSVTTYRCVHTLLMHRSQVLLQVSSKQPLLTQVLQQISSYTAGRDVK